MKQVRIASVLAGLVAGALLWPFGPAASQRSATTGSPFLPTPPFGPPKQIVLYVHAKSLARRGGHWELRVDPALFLSGLAATRAAVEDGRSRPGTPSRTTTTRVTRAIGCSPSASRRGPGSR